MDKNSKRTVSVEGVLNRREFIKAGAVGVGALTSSLSFGKEFNAARKNKKPNFLFFLIDQLRLDSISAHGCPYVNTPNIDRLVRRGTTFMESYSTHPICSPARSSFFTGRMPCETGVVSNNRGIDSSLPTMGHWFRNEGYEAVYSGKWHLPLYYPVEIPGWTVLPAGGAGQGDINDPVVSRVCEAYLRSRSRTKPFVLVASFLQPHDICFFEEMRLSMKGDIMPKQLPFESIRDRLPQLPPNHNSRPQAPERLDREMFKWFSDIQWRYYMYVYYRQVEMVDADIGRILDALEDCGEADNTIIILTADHGEGLGYHKHVQKWCPYEEAAKVPFIVSCPGRIPEGARDTTHLVSGLDVISTMCDYAAINPPPGVLGKSLRPLIAGKPTQWRQFVGFESYTVGRAIRTDDYKYVKFPDDPVEQLFDMKADPWETKNLYDDPKYADVMEDHRTLLAEWLARLKVVEPTPVIHG